ncbi:hypothetical protein PQZ38_00740 [Pelagibacteraceae bacterium]|jgi:phosphotransferase system  glucose/maltose/N-acetylglucosamine-specific IIC component|nr:hypothetical protein [Pelagibacteraceae bacterium]
MQLRLQPRSSRNLLNRYLVMKIILIFIVFFIGIFLIDKINFPTPTKQIKQEISNDKLSTLK